MLNEIINKELNVLGYKGMLSSFKENLELKKLSLNFQETFYKLIQAEMSHKSARSLSYRLELAKLPRILTFDQFDLDNVPFAKEKLTLLRQFNFIENSENILIIGGAGTGKTHIALSLGYEALKDYRVKFYRFIDLAKQLKDAQKNNKLDSLIIRLKNFDLLIIDELGYLPIDEVSGELLFELFSNLYETTSTIITTHLNFDEWNTIFGSKKSTKAIIDRITHHCQILETGNKSWRLKSTLERLKNKKGGVIK